MPQVYGNDFSSIMAAENQQRGQDIAKGESSINRLVGVMQQLKQNKMAQQQMQQHAYDAANELKLHQDQLDQTKKQFAQSVLDADNHLQLNYDKLAQEGQLSLAHLVTEAERNRLMAVAGSPAEREREFLSKSAQADALAGQFDPKRYAGKLPDSEIDYNLALHKQSLASQMADYNRSQAEADTLNREQELTAQTKETPWHLGSLGMADYNAKKAELTDVQTASKRLKDTYAHNFASRFVFNPKSRRYESGLPMPVDMNAPAPVPSSGLGMGNRASMEGSQPDPVMPATQIVRSAPAVSAPQSMPQQTGGTSVLSRYVASAPVGEVLGSEASDSPTAAAGLPSTEGRIVRDTTTGKRYRITNGQYVELPAGSP